LAGPPAREKKPFHARGRSPGRFGARKVGDDLCSFRRSGPGRTPVRKWASQWRGEKEPPGRANIKKNRFFASRERKRKGSKNVAGMERHAEAGGCFKGRGNGRVHVFLDEGSVQGEKEIPGIERKGKRPPCPRMTKFLPGSG